MVFDAQGKDVASKLEPEFTKNSNVSTKQWEIYI